jgi:mannose-6-phosphate isomerase-like protein (cupin superfamily)
MPNRCDIPPAVIGLFEESRRDKPYDNHVVTAVNDHVVRISTMTEPYPWHVHPNSDETFLVVEGRLRIEFDNGAVELAPRDMTTVPRGVCHRTMPVGSRSVNITFEAADAQTQIG